MLGLGIHDGEDVIESGVYFKIVKSRQSVKRSGRGYDGERRFFRHDTFVVVINHLGQLHLLLVHQLIFLTSFTLLLAFSRTGLGSLGLWVVRWLFNRRSLIFGTHASLDVILDRFLGKFFKLLFLLKSFDLWLGLLSDMNPVLFVITFFVSGLQRFICWWWLLVLGNINNPTKLLIIELFWCRYVIFGWLDYKVT